MEHHSFFQNTACAYFPCHAGVEGEQFNCLFCYCPLYALGPRCGGQFTYTPSGIKDCSRCTWPHRRENYEAMMEKLPQVLELAKEP